VAAGITAVIDFRGPAESGANPDKLPASIPALARPVYDPGNDFYSMVGKAVQGGPAVQQQMFGDGKAAGIMRDYYRWLVSDATARGRFGAAIRDVANATGPVLFHCTAGKDRTGWMTAILMTALGVPKGQVYKDYLESNDNLAAGNKALMDGLVAKGLVTDPALFDPILGVQRDFLDAAFDQAGASFGSFDRFVSEGLGVDGPTLEALKSKLLSGVAGRGGAGYVHPRPPPAVQGPRNSADYFTKSRTPSKTGDADSSATWPRHSVRVLVAPPRMVLSSGLMISSHGDHQVP
jgi:protein-tyrosine phosphatase